MKINNLRLRRGGIAAGITPGLDSGVQWLLCVGSSLSKKRVTNAAIDSLLDELIEPTTASVDMAMLSDCATRVLRVAECGSKAWKGTVDIARRAHV